MYTNEYLELDLFKVPLKLHWVRQGGKEWYMSTMLISTYVQSISANIISFYLYDTELHRKIIYLCSVKL